MIKNGKSIVKQISNRAQISVPNTISTKFATCLLLDEFFSFLEANPKQYCNVLKENKTFKWNKKRINKTLAFYNNKSFNIMPYLKL